MPDAEFWVVLGTVIAGVVLLILPGIVFAHYVLERWIDDRESYRGVIAAVERSRQ